MEADPEYQLIVDSNNILVEVDNEISKFLAMIVSYKCVYIQCTCIYMYIHVFK